MCASAVSAFSVFVAAKRAPPPCNKHGTCHAAGLISMKPKRCVLRVCFGAYMCACVNLNTYEEEKKQRLLNAAESVFPLCN